MVKIEERWLSVGEISKYLGVSSDTIYRWIERFDMPAHRMGRLWKFKKERVDDWVEAGGASAETSKRELGRRNSDKRAAKKNR